MNTDLDDARDAVAKLESVRRVGRWVGLLGWILLASATLINVAASNASFESTPAFLARIVMGIGMGILLAHSAYRVASYGKRS